MKAYVINISKSSVIFDPFYFHNVMICCPQVSITCQLNFNIQWFMQSWILIFMRVCWIWFWIFDHMHCLIHCQQLMIHRTNEFWLIVFKERILNIFKFTRVEILKMQVSLLIFESQAWFLLNSSFYIFEDLLPSILNTWWFAFEYLIIWRIQFLIFEWSLTLVLNILSLNL